MSAAKSPTPLPTGKALSEDGTEIVFERSGSGPPLILVDGALCSRSFGPTAGLAALLATHLTVYRYDRRGRGESGDRAPYSKQREVEDIAALVRIAGGSAGVLGFSSGGALALEAAAAGVGVSRVAVYEPPYMVNDGGHHARARHEQQLQHLIAQGRRGDAVTYFMRRMVGIPAPFVFLMRLMPRMWKNLKAVAHTLPYDAAIMGDFSIPQHRLADIRVPALALDGEKTDTRLRNAVTALARALPNVRRRTLAGQSHNVRATALAPVVIEFFSGRTPA